MDHLQNGLVGQEFEQLVLGGGVPAMALLFSFQEL